MSKSSPSGKVVLIQGTRWLVAVGDPKDLFTPAAFVREGVRVGNAQPLGTLLKFVTNAKDPTGKEEVSDELAQDILDQSQTDEYQKLWGRKH